MDGAEEESGFTSSGREPGLLSQAFFQGFLDLASSPGVEAAVQNWEPSTLLPQGHCICCSFYPNIPAYLLPSTLHSAQMLPSQRGLPGLLELSPAPSPNPPAPDASFLFYSFTFHCTMYFTDLPYLWYVSH